MKVTYINDAGECVAGTLTINGVDADEVMLYPPFFQSVAAAEWDLIRRYDRGDFA